MKAVLAAACAAGIILMGGCATKKYVRNTEAPIQAKVDQVNDQTNKNTQAIDQTNGQVKDVDERAQRGISAAREQAQTGIQDAADAYKHAGDALDKANQAAQSSEQNKQDLAALRQTVANIDDYKLQTSATAEFQFNQSKLTPDARAGLDSLANQVQSDRRYVIAVEGFTDSTGPAAYNEELSRKRADAVVEYLVAQRDVPVYKICMVGLGAAKPVDEAKTREARAKNRRVEVRVYTADETMASLAGQSSQQQPQQ
jgi:outer membrane protein OmpA-like peptidoglycan-associated protein